MLQRKPEHLDKRYETIITPTIAVIIVSYLLSRCSGFLCNMGVNYSLWVLVFSVSYLFTSFHLAKLFAPKDVLDHFALAIILPFLPVFAFLIWLVFFPGI